MDIGYLPFDGIGPARRDAKRRHRIALGMAQTLGRAKAACGRVFRDRETLAAIPLRSGADALALLPK